MSKDLKIALQETSNNGPHRISMFTLADVMQKSETQDFWEQAQIRSRILGHITLSLIKHGSTGDSRWQDNATIAGGFNLLGLRSKYDTSGLIC